MKEQARIQSICRIINIMTERIRNNDLEISQNDMTTIHNINVKNAHGWDDEAQGGFSLEGYSRYYSDKIDFSYFKFGVLIPDLSTKFSDLKVTITFDNEDYHTRKFKESYKIEFNSCTDTENKHETNSTTPPKKIKDSVNLLGAALKDWRNSIKNREDILKYIEEKNNENNKENIQ